MRKIFILSLGLCFGLFALVANADTFKLADGGSVTGDILKFDDASAMIHVSEDNYTNVLWSQFSQEALQQLSANPKIQPLVAPFINPTPSASADIPVKPVVNRWDLPANRSVIGGIFHSPLGIFILLVLYGANLFAGYEISLVKARTAGQVVGVAAILPVIGPIIFLCMPMQVQPTPEEIAAIQEPFPEGEQTPEQIQIVEASWNTKPEEKKPEPQLFPRGKFTFNKRFVETKFASFMGDGKSGDAAKYTMELRTAKDVFTVDRIMQVAMAEVILEIMPRGQVTVQLTEIQEIKLNPKTTA